MSTDLGEDHSTYSVTYALNQFGDEKNAAKLYGKMSDERIIELVRQETTSK